MDKDSTDDTTTEVIEKKVKEKIPWSAYTLGYWLLRLFIGGELVMSGLGKFKYIDTAGVTYSIQALKDKAPKIVAPIVEYSGFPAWFGSIANFYSMALAFIMVGVGTTILIGFLNRLSLFAAGLIWISLAFGLMILPDNEAVLQLGVRIAIVAGALCLVKHNKLFLTPW